ncbi:enhancer of mRNA-decapping protein 4 isoform X2 [Rhipicephalus microplus]|uniref:enhancer of mRNA-decapping protein 4 isoform X2 n=1 Tax=Rhipicephalus microplus TaxID=6941 RepID=UPI003F6C4ECD
MSKPSVSLSEKELRFLEGSAEDSSQAVLLPKASPSPTNATWYSLPADHVLWKLLRSAPASSAAERKTLDRDTVEGNAPPTTEKETASAVSKMKLTMSKLIEEFDSLSQIVSGLSTQLDQQCQMTLKIEKDMLHWTTKLSSFKATNKTYKFHCERAKACVHQMTEREQVSINRQGYIVADKLSTILAPRIENLIAVEFKKSVAPAVRKLVESTKHEIKRKANKTETLVQTCIRNRFRSKAMAGTLTRTINPPLRVEINDVCREVLQNNFIRKIDLVCRDISLQLSKTFDQGLKEILQEIQKDIVEDSRGHAKKALKNIDSNLHTRLQAFFSDHKANLITPDMEAQFDEAVRKSVANFKSGALEAVAAQNTSFVDSLTEAVYGAVKEAVGADVSERMQSCFKVNVSLLDPHVVLHEIKFLVQQGQYNMAFSQALSAADPFFVVSTCEMVCPTITIGKDPCPLETPVLLSLIGKLSEDLATKTTIKIKYLEAAVLSLVKEGTASQSSEKCVLTQLFNKIEELLKQNPPRDMERMAKHLNLVIQSSLCC